MDMSEIVRTISATVPIPDEEYVDIDGLKRCKKCDQRTEKLINIMGVQRKVRIICKCEQDKLDAQEQKDRDTENDVNRKICFSAPEMRRLTFNKDDGRDPQKAKIMRRYAETFPSDGVNGLLMYGSIGTGKSFYSACIANALIDRGYKVLMTNTPTLINQFSGSFGGRQEIIDDLERYALLIIDDLGAERTSEYAQEIIYNVIDSRYQTGRPMIVSTNLTWEKLSETTEETFSRTYDRILERCLPVEFSGNSRRRDIGRAGYRKAMERLS